MNLRRLLSGLCFLCIACAAQAQQPAEHALVIAFWNVENLYDTINDPLKEDEEFTPTGKNSWNSERYRTKLEHLAKVIMDLGPQGPAVIGLCEIENVEVLRDLCGKTIMAPVNYQPVLAEGPDVRGVDPALLYDPDVFTLSHYKAFSVLLADSHKTRDILLVDGVLAGKRTCFLVNHWPSRRGGELSSRQNRLSAARVLKKICDSLSAIPVAPAIVVMGDFNDDPSDESIRYLGISAKPEDTGNLFYNAMVSLQKRGLGSLAYRDSWNLFDQIMFRDLEGWQLLEAQVYNKGYLRHDHGNYKGYPFRTYSGGVYTGGYSDHFPVYLIMKSTAASD